MFAKLLMLLVCYSGFGGYDSPTVTTYTLDKPAKEVIETLINDSHGEGEVTIPELVKKAPILIQTKFFPYKGYYRVDITLVEPYNRVCAAWKCLEVWSDRERGKTIVRSTVDIKLLWSPRLRLLERLKERILGKVECEILQKEYEFIKKLEK